MNGPHLPQEDLQSLSGRLTKSRVPLQGGLEVTHRCNLRCVHCYCRLSPDDEAARSGELTVDEIRRLATQFAQEGCLYLYVTGGEPLLRKEFLEIYDSIRDQGILVTLFTNGTLLTPRIADHLAERPPFSVEISLYGATREVYESITGIPGSHTRCLRGIHLLVERGIKVTLKTPALSLNKQEVGALQSLADELGAQFRCDGALFPRLETVADRFGPYQYALSPAEQVQLDMRTEQQVEAWQAYLERLRGQPRPITLFSCGAGEYGFFVDPYGQLMMCVEARYPSYDLRHGTFKEGWGEFLRDVRHNWLAEADAECLSCTIYALCHQCPGRSLLEHGPQGIGRVVDAQCRLARVRAGVFEEAGIIHLEKLEHTKEKKNE